MISKITNIFKVPELRNKIAFTAALLFVFRLGGIVLVPGVDREVVKEFIAFSQTGAGSIFGLYNLFAGGFFSQFSIFALGIMPYISASIIIQLLGAVVPYFQRLQKEGPEGRKKIIESIKKEIKKANDKENYLDEEERELIKNFIIKIKKELN